ncbi:hypothetical protein NE237_030526 [Protea cynaroides]|uniref:Uncharacterized protein n=1 Tax=Protea cynaroides TaxID=273540 RepID=A0A9Q0GY12_9MAGN|nr:hypothetical protein NE237_030526 [Protea cynaroides]
MPSIPFSMSMDTEDARAISTLGHLDKEQKVKFFEIPAHRIRVKNSSGLDSGLNSCSIINAKQLEIYVGPGLIHVGPGQTKWSDRFSKEITTMLRNLHEASKIQCNAVAVH